tara:strand:+ start:1731 stop:4286 length:2556 start_codon:yes stop_codon:yes gene_type:complete
MIVQKINNKTLLLQVIDSVRVVNNNEFKFLIFDLFMSNNKNIKKIKKIGITFTSSDQINLNTTIIDDFEKTFFYRNDNHYVFSIPIFESSEFIDSNTFNIFVMDEYNNILDSSGNIQIEKIRILFNNTSNNDNDILEFIIDNRESKNVSFDYEVERQRFVIFKNNVDINNVELYYGDIKIGIVQNIESSNNLKVDINLNNDNHLSFLKNVYKKYIIDFTSLSQDSVIEMYLCFNIKGIKFTKTFFLSLEKILPLVSIYANYLISYFNDKIIISEVQKSFNQSKLKFTFSKDISDLLDFIIIKDFLHNGVFIQEIYGNATFNNDNKIIFKNKKLMSTLSNKTLNYFYETENNYIDQVLIKIEGITGSIPINVNNLNRQLSSDFIENAYLSLYIQNLSQLSINIPRQEFVYNQGINNIFRFDELSINKNNSFLHEFLNYSLIDADNNQVFSFDEMLNKGIYCISISFLYNNIIIDSKKTSCRYEDLSKENFINNIIDTLIFDSSTILPSEINELFSSLIENRKIEILNAIDNFNIDINIEIIPLFDLKEINSYRFMGFDQDIFNQDGIYSIKNIYSENTEEHNRDLIRFISSIKNNNLNFSIINNFVGEYLSSNFNDYQKCIFIERLLEEVFQDTRLENTFKISSTINKSDLIRHYRSDTVNYFRLYNHNLYIKKISKNTAYFKSKRRFVNRENLSYNPNNNVIVIETNDLSSEYFININYYFNVDDELVNYIPEKFEHVRNKLYYNGNYMENSNRFYHFTNRFKNVDVIRHPSDNRKNLIVFDMNRMFLFDSEALQDLFFTASSMKINKVLSSINFSANIYNKNNYFIKSLDVEVKLEDIIIDVNEKINLLN